VQLPLAVGAGISTIGAGAAFFPSKNMLPFGPGGSSGSGGGGGGGGTAIVTKGAKSEKEVIFPEETTLLAISTLEFGRTFQLPVVSLNLYILIVSSESPATSLSV